VNIGAIAVAFGGALLAALLTAAENSLVPGESEPTGTPRPIGDGVRRERARRALAFARIAAQLGTGAAAAVALRTLAVSDAVVTAIAIIAAVVAGAVIEGIARGLAARRSQATRELEPIVRIVGGLLSPLGGLDARFDRTLAELLPPVEPDDAERDATDQFRQIVSHQASVTRDEANLITGVFSLGDTPVRDVMIPRVDIVGIERSLPWSQVIDRVRSSEHARFPVFEDTLDEVIGLLFAKDLLPAVIAGGPPPGGWLSLLRPAPFIPQTKPVDQQLRDFQATRQQLAIVVDEYGGTAGLVTIEDILEEIVGEIHDEHDVEEPEIEQREGRRFWVSGRVPLHDLAEVLGHEFEHDDAATVGGLIYERLGRVPRSGESLSFDGFRVVVERVVRRRVERVYFERESTIAGREAR
jgi:CBS domain containing-hemolysin-like protein